MVLNPTMLPSPSRNTESLPSLGPLWDESWGLPALLGAAGCGLSHSLQQKWRGPPGQEPVGTKARKPSWWQDTNALVRRNPPSPVFSRHCHRLAGQAEVGKGP